MTEYIQRRNGQWVDVTFVRHVACCDCGLVHKEEYRIVISDDADDSIIRRVFRDNRATANRRQRKEVKQSIKALTKPKGGG